MKSRQLAAAAAEAAPHPVCVPPTSLAHELTEEPLGATDVLRVRLASATDRPEERTRREGRQVNQHAAPNPTRATPGTETVQTWKRRRDGTSG